MPIISQITKPDLIDPGAEEEVRQLLLGNKTKDFKLGFNMVKGRGQKDVNDGMTLEEAAASEKHFFSVSVLTGLFV